MRNFKGGSVRFEPSLDPNHRAGASQTPTVYVPYPIRAISKPLVHIFIKRVTTPSTK